MLKLSKVERLPAKLEIMSFMSTFYEYLHAVRPRIDSICLASKSTRNSKKFKKIYGVQITYASTCAVHLDITQDYSMEVFVYTIHKLKSVRGEVRKMISNPRTQLEGVS